MLLPARASGGWSPSRRWRARARRQARCRSVQWSRRRAKSSGAANRVRVQHRRSQRSIADRLRGSATARLTSAPLIALVTSRTSSAGVSPTARAIATRPPASPAAKHSAGISRPPGWLPIRSPRLSQRQHVSGNGQRIEETADKCRERHAFPLRKASPASAIAPPAARTAKRPAGQRARSPNAMPARCSRPVAITKPTRIGDRVGSRRQFGAVGMAVEDREDRRPALRRPTAAAAPPAPPSCRARPRTPRSRFRPQAAATPRMPSAPPTAITSGKTIGRSQIAGAPRKAPHSPTATIATT